LTRIDLLHCGEYDLIRVLTVWHGFFLDIATYQMVVDLFTRCYRNRGIEEVETHFSKRNLCTRSTRDANIFPYDWHTRIVIDMVDINPKNLFDVERL